MSEWKKMKLGDMVTFNPKLSLPKGSLAKKVAMEHLSPFTKYVTKFELSSYTGGAKFMNGDTLLARITPCLENGKTSQVTLLNEGEIGFGSTEFIVLRAKDGIADKDFIYYLAISPQFRDYAIKSMVGSSGRQRVQQDVLENMYIDCPSISEQKAIAAVLSALDDKIELNNRINKNLETQAQAIFKSWFVDFEPFRDGEFVDSELGPIPKGWRVGQLGDIIELFDSKRIPLSSNDRNKMRKLYPYYGAASLMDYVDDFLFDGVYLLLGEDGTVSDVNGYPILQYVYGKFWVNNHAHVLCGENGFSVESLYILLKSTSIRSAVTGAVQPKINQANLKAIKIVLPQKQKLEHYNNFVAPLFKTIRKNRDENAALAALRGTLLPKLMSGEIRVPLEV